MTFIIDADGILNVRARDSDTQQETQATMQVIGAPTEPGPDGHAGTGGVASDSTLPSAL